MTGLGSTGDAIPRAADPRRQRRRRHVALGGAVLALGMAAVWVAVVPDKAEETTGLQSWAIRYGHPASWICLAGLGLAIAGGAPRRVRDLLAWTALGSYGAFLLGLAL